MTLSQTPHSLDNHDFAAPLQSVVERARQTVALVFAYIKAQGDTDYIGERISQLEHSLQAATLAREAGAEDELVVAALLHDIGRFIPAAEKMERMVAKDGTYVGRASHEILGEAFLRDLGFSERVCQVVGAHVMAKRYLTATDEAYYAALSESSKKTLKFQVKEAQKDPWLDAKLSVRRWDDLAKEPDAVVPPLEAYEPVLVSTLLESWSTFSLHERNYQLPRRPTVVICVDGFDPEYLGDGIARGIIPNLAYMRSRFAKTARCVMPSFTNPNNVSIITGAPTASHGIAGNFFLDKETGEEHMITDASLLRGSTILAELSKRGVRVAAVTAKEKLRKILAAGLDLDSDHLNGPICFSAETANSASIFNGDGRPVSVDQWLEREMPSQYSADLSLFVLDAGVKILQENRADFFYLTLSDYVQHHHAPGSTESDDFLKGIDDRIGQLIALGADVTVTGDHGMSHKTFEDSTPNILFLQDLLEEKFHGARLRVICPITDPFVKHHGGLGSFVRVHVQNREGLNLVPDMIAFSQSLPQIELALSGAQAATLWEMPLDREGDFVVIATKHAVIGSKKSDHDLTALNGRLRLRSHGGLSEEAVPLLSTVPVSPAREWLCCRPRNGTQLYAKSSKSSPPDVISGPDWRNFDAFAVALNGRALDE